MKLLRAGELGKELPAILDNENKIRNLSKLVEDFRPDTLNFQTLEKIRRVDLLSLIHI